MIFRLLYLAEKQSRDVILRDYKVAPRAGEEIRRETMLILTRKIDQAIVIDGNILVRVLGVERDRVKLGIAADEAIIILREELVGRQHNPPVESSETPARR